MKVNPIFLSLNIKSDFLVNKYILEIYFRNKVLILYGITSVQVVDIHTK